jgi:hypothetical protein
MAHLFDAELFGLGLGLSGGVEDANDAFVAGRLGTPGHPRSLFE